ncbi:RimJ/RimL family protein N-acetyltransferase [Aquimarina intermedia]|uniref:RimJ/RimL family protein N-acetyltransferase n=2 Tax=Aquimarina intermedia TaxID=350814 RepID=A0A5S5BX79_9FLAO|nr:RimJ/RimL family protein N-acetyltransferase [Aquimarina intermedia]
MSQYPTFETERLILRLTELEDAPFILELFNSPKWIQFIGDRNLRTIEQAEKYIAERMRAQLAHHDFSNYTVIRKEDQVKLGNCGLYDREGVDGIDIGFAFLPQYEGKGYAFEAANELKEQAFNRFQLPELHAITDKDNTGSQRLIEKLGLRFNRYITLPDETEEIMLYSLIKDIQ